MEREGSKPNFLERLKMGVYKRMSGMECTLLEKPFCPTLGVGGRATDALGSSSNSHENSARAYWRRQPKGKLTAQDF